MAYFKSWRLRVTEAVDPIATSISIYQIDFYGLDESTATAASSASNPSFPPANIIDGNVSGTPWISNGKPADISVTVANPVEVTGMRIFTTFTFPSAPRDFEVQGSNDTTDGVDGTWETVHTVSNFTNYASNGWTEFTGFQTDPKPIALHRVNELPGTTAASSMYIVKDTSNDNARKAWRLRITMSHITNMLVNEIEFVGMGAATSFGSVTGSAANAFDDDLGTVVTDTHAIGEEATIGQISTAGNVEVTSVIITNNEWGFRDPQEFVLEASDDTTNGSDGTWDVIQTYNSPVDWEGENNPVTFNVTNAGNKRAELHFTDALNTTTRSVIGYQTVDDKIANALGLYSDSTVVADIAARDALTLTSDSLVLVADASADATVTSGAAMYYYKQSADTWTKTYEFEGMDIVLSWANLSGKPTSSVAAIDGMVTDSHTHANTAVLDNIGEDGTTNNLTFNSQELSGNPVVLTEEW